MNGSSQTVKNSQIGGAVNAQTYFENTLTSKFMHKPWAIGSVLHIDVISGFEENGNKVYQVAKFHCFWLLLFFPYSVLVVEMQKLSAFKRLKMIVYF